jgi:hypothetical protein
VCVSTRNDSGGLVSFRDNVVVRSVTDQDRERERERERESARSCACVCGVRACTYISI